MAPALQEAYQNWKETLKIFSVSSSQITLPILSVYSYSSFRI